MAVIFDFLEQRFCLFHQPSLSIEVDEVLASFGLPVRFHTFSCMPTALSQSLLWNAKHDPICRSAT